MENYFQEEKVKIVAVPGKWIGASNIVFYYFL
jgi:hypothetical protein